MVRTLDRSNTCKASPRHETWNLKKVSFVSDSQIETLNSKVYASFRILVAADEVLLKPSHRSAYLSKRRFRAKGLESADTIMVISHTALIWVTWGLVP